MQPVAVEHRSGKGMVIVPRCADCGFVRPNRVADDRLHGDSIDALIALMGTSAR